MVVPNTTVMPTGMPTVMPTVIPTVIPIPIIQPGGTDIVYIVFGSLAGVILLIILWYKCKSQPVQPILQADSHVAIPMPSTSYRAISPHSPTVKPLLPYTTKHASPRISTPRKVIS